MTRRTERARWWRAMIVNTASVVAILAASRMPVHAQTTTSTLEGTVRDVTGGVLPGAIVRAVGATIDRAVAADERGFYRLVPLQPGTYTVTASRQGFAPRIVNEVALAIDRSVTLDLVLEVGGRAESILVAPTSLLIDETTSSYRGVIDARTIDAIPLNGRNYLDLVQLMPGVAVNDTARAAPDGGVRDTRGAMLGERAGNAAFLIDGVENSDDFRGGVLQSFTQDAIQEFEVIEAGYKAEFGRGSGGVVNVITKSGTNAVGGSAFFFLRDDALDTSNVKDEAPPALSRYNAGLTIGGPVSRDRAWFFGSFEHFSETRGVIFAPTIPPILKVGEDFSRQPEVHVLRPFVKYARKAGAVNDVRAALSYTRETRDNELASPTSLPSNSLNNIAHTTSGSLAATTVLGNRVFLEHAFSVRAHHFDQNQGSAGGDSYAISLLDGGGSFGFGPPAGSGLSLRQRYYTVREVANLFHGSAHAAKAGIEYIRTVVDATNDQGFTHVLATTGPLFATYGLESFQIPQGVAFVNAGDDRTRLRNDGFGLFVQDDWRPHETVTLNLGLRYDYDATFDDANNVAPRLGVVWSPAERTAVSANWGVFYDRYRLGIVQAVPEFGGFNGRTVVEFDYPRLTADALVNIPGSLTRVARAVGDPLFIHRAFGIPSSAVVTAANVQSLTGLAPAQFLSALTTLLQATGVSFVPVDFSPLTGYLRQDRGAGFQDEIQVARPFRTPGNRTLVVGVQQALGSHWSVKAAYVHRRIENVLGVRITNLAFEARTIGAPVTADGAPLQRTYGPFYDGTYDALSLSVDKRFADRYQFQASYTGAKSIDNLLNPNLGIGIAAQGGGAVPTDNLDVNVDRGNSDLSVPHSVVASGVVHLPYGVRVSGVFRATSGVYFTASGGVLDYDGDGITSRRPIGTARNEFRGPKTANLDLRLEKRVQFGRYVAAALVEFFNITNARNPRLIDNFYVNRVPGPTFGEVLVPLPGREAQFGLRLTF